MRVFMALLLPVSLAFAVTGPEGWRESHNTGMEKANASDFAGAGQWFEESWRQAVDDTERAISAADLGISLHECGRDKEARRWLETSLANWKTANSGGADPRAARTATALASVLRILAEYQGSERVLREYLSTSAATGDARAGMLNALADLLREEGRTAESSELFASAAQVEGAKWRTVAETHMGLAELAREAHNRTQSQSELSLVSTAGREHGDANLEAAATLGSAEAWLDSGNTARAEPLLRAALSAFEKSSHRSDHQIAITLSSLGRLYMAEGRNGLAEESLQRAVQISEKSLGAHPQVAMLLQLAGSNAAVLHRFDEARLCFSRALDIMNGAFGKESAVSAAVQANWAVVETRANNVEEALARLRTSLRILSGAGEQVTGFRMLVMQQYAQTLKMAHHQSEARAVLAELRSFR